MRCKDTTFFRNGKHFGNKYQNKFVRLAKNTYLCTRKRQKHGAIAQLVEQRTENPCVTGSIPVGTTEKKTKESKILISQMKSGFFISLWKWEIRTYPITAKHIDHYRQNTRNS